MQKQIKLVFIILTAVAYLFSSNVPTYAHSGGLDRYGGHCVGGADRDGYCPSGNYHYHNKTNSKSKSRYVNWGKFWGGVAIVTLVITAIAIVSRETKRRSLLLESDEEEENTISYPNIHVNNNGLRIQLTW